MAFLDKFNDWYGRLIPPTGPGFSVSWMEPAAGAQHRWRTRLKQTIIILAVVFLVVLFLPEKSSQPRESFEYRLLMAVAVTAFVGISGWVSSQLPTNILLRADRVTIGKGRGSRRVSLAQAREVSLKRIDGYLVLLITNPNGKEERIYLDSPVEKEVKELLTKAGRLAV